MPLYNSPLLPPKLLQKGVPSYLFGSLNMMQGNTKGQVSQTANNTTIATLTVQINQGPIPNVGDLITVWGTALQAGIFNVNRAVITAVSITPGTNAGTISYALVGTTQTATADPGAFLCEASEVGETLTTNTFSVPVVVQAPQGDSQFTLPLAVAFSSGVTAAVVTLQVAIRDINAEYTNTTTVVTLGTTGPVVLATLQRGYVYRLAVTGVTGTGTIVAKVG